MNTHEEKLKVASTTLITSIVGINSKNPKKYYALVKEHFNLSQDEFESINEDLLTDGLQVDEMIDYIKDTLDDNMYQVMQFLKILNKFAILDGCNQKSYHEFELIRDKFLKNHY